LLWASSETYLYKGTLYLSGANLAQIDIDPLTFEVSQGELRYILFEFLNF